MVGRDRIELSQLSRRFLQTECAWPCESTHLGAVAEEGLRGWQQSLKVVKSDRDPNTVLDSPRYVVNLLDRPGER